MSTKSTILLEEETSESIHFYRDCLDDRFYINYQRYGKGDIDITFTISDELAEKLKQPRCIENY